jgi:hypothetical protein
MDYKKAFEKLVKIAENQQKIIEKMAQQISDNTDMILGDQKAPDPVAPPPPTNLKATPPPKREADAILAALPPDLKSALKAVEVVGGNVSLKFLPGKATQPNYDAIKAIIQQLQNGNKLPAQSYNVHVVE